jgi:hypothetical protein
MKEDAVAWLEHFEQAASGNRWDVPAMLRWVGSYLDGAASSWWIANKSQITTWKNGEDPKESLPGSFYYAFIQAFITPELQNLWFSDLMRCRQQKNEDVSQFAMRVRDLAKRVRFTRNILDEQVSDIFLQGIPMQLRRKILDYETDQMDAKLDFERRIQRALKYELNCRFSGDVAAITPDAVEVPTKTENQQPTVNSTSATPEKSEEDNYQKLAKQISILVERVNELSSRSQRGLRPCPTCQLVDSNHNWRECRDKKQKDFQ